MQWNDICLCILLMDIFGSVGFLLGCLLKKGLDRASARVRLVFAKLVVCLYLAPVIYPILLLSRLRYMEGSWVRIGEFGFYVPERVEMIFRILGGVWVGGLLIGVAISCYHYSRLDRVLQWNEPLATDEWEQTAERYLRKYRMTAVAVYQNEAVLSAMVAGLIKPMIIVPQRNCSEKQRSMMMEHEIWHVRRRDLLWKKLALAASWLHWFNPLVYKLRDYLTLQQELVCDNAVCDINPEYTPKEYCEFLYDVEVTEAHGTFAATFIETGLSLEHRVREMMRRRKLVRMSRGWILACMTAFVIVASLPTFALAQGIVRLDEALRASAEILIDETPQPGASDGSGNGEVLIEEVIVEEGIVEEIIVEEIIVE